MARDGFVSDGMEPGKNKGWMSGDVKEEGGRDGLEPVVEGEIVDRGWFYLEGAEKTGVVDGAVIHHAGDEGVLRGDIAEAG